MLQDTQIVHNIDQFNKTWCYDSQHNDNQHSVMLQEMQIVHNVDQFNILALQQ